MSSSDALPHTPHDDVAKKFRRSRSASNGARQRDRDHVVALLLVIEVVAVGDAANLARSDQPLGEQEPGRELEVAAGRAHRHGDAWTRPARAPARGSRAAPRWRGCRRARQRAPSRTVTTRTGVTLRRTCSGAAMSTSLTLRRASAASGMMRAWLHPMTATSATRRGEPTSPKSARCWHGGARGSAALAVALGGRPVAARPARRTQHGRLRRARRRVRVARRRADPDGRPSAPSGARGPSPEGRYRALPAAVDLGDHDRDARSSAPGRWSCCSPST